MKYVETEEVKRYKLSDYQLFGRILKYMKPEWWRYVISILLVGLSVGLDVLSPLITSFSLKELGRAEIM